MERKDYQYLYPETEDFVFMDLETYEQIHVPRVLVGDAADYLMEGARGARWRCTRVCRSRWTFRPPWC